MRRSVSLVVVVGLLLGLGACSSAIKTNGMKVTEPEQVLVAALAKLKEDNATAIGNGSATVSDKTGCFFVKASADAEEVGDTVACGPIRRLGVDKAKSWDTYALELQQNADGDVTAAIKDEAEPAVAVDPNVLVSAGGDGPAAVDDVPEPKAPAAEVTDTAVLMGADKAGDVKFENLDKPWQIITPAATVQVTASGKPEFLPRALASPEGDEGEGAPYYRPAEGQQLLAFKVQIAPPAEKDVPASSGTGDYVDMTSAMSVTVADGKELSISDIASGGESSESEGEGSGDSWTIACVGASSSWGGGSRSFPCDRTETTEAVLIMTVPTDAKPLLQAKVNGGAQSISLDSGELTSSSSQVEYQRGALTAKVGQQARSTKKLTYESFGDKESVTATFTWNIDSVALSAFDPTRGWAGDGEAWLLVSTSKYDKNATDYRGSYFEDTANPSVTVSGSAVKPDLSDDSWEKGQHVFAFKVPDSTTAGTFNFQPAGTFTGGESDQRFTASKSAVKFSLPK